VESAVGDEAGFYRRYHRQEGKEKNETKSEVNYLVIVGIHDMMVRLELLCLQTYIDTPVIDWR